MGWLVTDAQPHAGQCGSMRIPPRRAKFQCMGFEGKRLAQVRFPELLEMCIDSDPGAPFLMRSSDAKARGKAARVAGLAIIWPKLVLDRVNVHWIQQQWHVTEQSSALIPSSLPQPGGALSPCTAATKGLTMPFVPCPVLCTFIMFSAPERRLRGQDFPQHARPIFQAVCSSFLEELGHSIQAQTRKSARAVSTVACLTPHTAELVALRPLSNWLWRYVHLPLPGTSLISFPVFISVAQTFLKKPNNVCLIPLSAFVSDFITVWNGYSCSDLQFRYAI